MEGGGGGERRGKNCCCLFFRKKLLPLLLESLASVRIFFKEKRRQKVLEMKGKELRED